MKKMFLLLGLLCCFVFLGTANSQVIYDFEDAALGTAGFGYWWGEAGSNLRQMTDVSGGVLAIDITATGDCKAAFGVDPFDMKWTETTEGAAFVSFDVFLPEDTPDSLLIKAWSQDKTNWTWMDVKYSPLSGWNGADVLKKGQWNTIWFPIKRMRQMNTNYLPWNAKGGLELFFQYPNGWTGTIMVDNVSLWGVEPKVVADFEDAALGTAGFSYGWGNAGANLQQTVDATYGGVMTMDLTATGDGKAAIAIDPFDYGWTETTEGAGFTTFDVMLPADAPDSVMIKVWSQDKTNWTWMDKKYSPLSGWSGSILLKKGIWNTIDFPIKRMRQLNANYLPWNAKGGMEIFFGTKNGWTGTILIDNVQNHTLETGKKWVVADWEKESMGTQDFANTGWAVGLTGLSWAADPSGASAGVMKTAWDFNLASKGSFQRDPVDLQWKDDGGEIIVGATKISFDVWVPADMPDGAQFSIWAQDHNKWTWTETKFMLSDSTFNKGGWTTLIYDVVAMDSTNGDDFNPVYPIKLGFQIYYAVANTWAGDVYFDNFTLWDVEKPEGALQSPAVAVEVDTAEVTGVLMGHVTWTDNADNLNETYNVYASTSAITDLTGEGVVRIGTKIGRGIQNWNHQPYTSSGSDVTYYYAVTAVGLDGEETALNELSAAGPVTFKSNVTYKAVYDPNFAFAIDGSLAEFSVYADYNLDIETVGVDAAGDWTPASTDLNLSQFVIVINDEYMYIGANVIDDDLATEGQSWEGDALEIYLGFYDAMDLTVLHDLDTWDDDYRIAFTSWGETQAGSSPTDFPGMEYLILPSPTGYQIEAKIAIDSIATAGWKPTVGDLLPFKVDLNDKDVVADGTDSGRSKQLHIGGSDNDQSWLRPSSWSYIEVYSPTAVAEADLPNIPTKTELYNNYPNPFNPTTHIKYDLATNSNVSLVIYNMLGQKIKTLIDMKKAAGYHSINWDGTNDAGVKVSSGVYFYRLKTENYSHTNKMILMK